MGTCRLDPSTPGQDSVVSSLETIGRPQITAFTANKTDGFAPTARVGIVRRVPVSITRMFCSSGPCEWASPVRRAVAPEGDYKAEVCYLAWKRLVCRMFMSSIAATQPTFGRENREEGLSRRTGLNCLYSFQSLSDPSHVILRELPLVCLGVCLNSVRATDKGAYK